MKYDFEMGPGAMTHADKVTLQTVICEGLRWDIILWKLLKDLRFLLWRSQYF
jgi:hypothetical protein